MDNTKFNIQFIKDRFKNGLEESQVFQDLVSEIILSSYKKKNEDSTLEPFATKSADGLVDFYIKHDEVTIIGDAKKSINSKARRKAIDALKTKISLNLSKDELPKRYTPWLKCSEFKVCFSSNATGGEKEIFEAELTACLESIKSTHRDFSAIKVSVHFWSYLFLELQNDSFLFHKWIKDSTPYGIYTLASYKEQLTESYRKYLLTENLTYVSRDDYKEANNLTGKSFVTENELLSALDESKGLIIYGEGGIGKSRLTYRLAEILEDKKNVVFCITRHFRDINALDDILMPSSADFPNTYYFIIDYIEEQSAFFELSDFISSCRKYDIKLIANCRTSYFFNYKEDFSTNQLSAKSISVRNSNEENSFKEFVVSRIFMLFGEGYRRDLLRIAENRPSFAVFLLFFYKDKKQPLDNIKSFEDFTRWMNHRISLSLDLNERDFPPSLYHLIASLPLKGEIVTTLVDKYGDEFLESLTKDWWVEYFENEKTLSVPQDTIADYLLLNHFKKIDPQFRSRTTRQFFNFADSFESPQLIENLIISFQRIIFSDDGRLIDSKSFLSILTNTLNDDSYQSTNIPELLCKTILLTELDRLNLYESNYSFFQEYFTSMSFGLSLSYTLNYFFKKDILDDDGKKFIKEKLIPHWYESNPDLCHYPVVASRFLSTYWKFFGEDEFILPLIKEYIGINAAESQKILHGYLCTLILESSLRNNYEYQEWAIKWLRNNYFYDFASFSIQALNNSFPDDSDLEGYVSGWINNNLGSESFTFIAKIYLRQARKTNAAQFVIEQWLNSNSESQHFTFLASDYINITENISNAQTAIEHWINKNIESEYFYFIASRYIKKVENITAIQTVIEQWINKNIETEQFTFVAYEFIKKVEDISTVQAAIEQWINNNYESEQFTFVAHEFIKKAEDISTVRAAIDQWINNNLESERFKFITSDYLGKIKDISAISSVVERWINKNLESDSFTFIAIEYINKTKNLVKIQPAVEQWINNNLASESFTFISSIYLRNVESIAVTQSTLAQWINENSNSEQFKFITGHYLNKAEDTTSVQHTIEQWINNNSKSESFGLVAGEYLKNVIDISAAESTIEQWIITNPTSDSFAFIAQHYIDKAENIATVQPTIEQWINNNIDSKKFKSLTPEYLKKIETIDPIQFAVEQWINNNLESKSFTFTAKEYINKSKSIENTQSTIEQWINNNPTSDKFTFITFEYINKTDNISATQPTIEQWINNNLDSDQFNFVTHEYLKKVENISVAQSTIEQWINKNLTSKHFSFITYEYIKKSKNITAIQSTTVQWMNNNLESSRFNFIAFEYLKKNKDITDLRSVLEQWINNNLESESFTFIAHEYLKIIKKTTAVQSTIEIWINNNLKSDSFTFIAYEYLRKTKNTDAIHATVENWIINNSASDSFTFVTREYLKRAKHIDSIQSSVEVWINNNLESKDFSFVTNEYLKKAKNTSATQNIIEHWINNNIDSKSFTYITSEFLKKITDATAIQTTVEQWMGQYIHHENYIYIAQEYLNKNPRLIESINQIKSFLNSPKAKKEKFLLGYIIKFHSESPYLETVAELSFEFLNNDQKKQHHSFIVNKLLKYYNFEDSKLKLFSFASLTAETIDEVDFSILLTSYVARYKTIEKEIVSIARTILQTTSKTVVKSRLEKLLNDIG